MRLALTGIRIRSKKILRRDSAPIEKKSSRVFKGW